MLCSTQKTRERGLRKQEKRRGYVCTALNVLHYLAAYMHHCIDIDINKINCACIGKKLKADVK
jgi:hypothetical protein